MLLVEADGSRRLPLKAHAPHEPVIPKEAGCVLCVVGARGFDRPIRKAVHRPEQFCTPDRRKAGRACLACPCCPRARRRRTHADDCADRRGREAALAFSAAAQQYGLRVISI